MTRHWFRSVADWGSRVAVVAFGLALADWGIEGVCSAFAGEDQAEVTPTRKPTHLPYIDSMLEQAWKDSKLTPARPATDEEFLRRAYLDLLGRIPTVEEARAFLIMKGSDKRPKLIEYLLNHPDYAKNFASQWAILLIGRGGRQQMVDRNALLSWLRKQFASNRPWNEVVHDLIAASGSNKENGAVNYVLAHLEFGAVPLTSLTTRLFLGQQIQCTQCHNHPTNDWKQDDFWGINAFFKGLRTERVNKPTATGLEAYDHTELHDEPTDEYVRFERRNGLIGIAFPRFLDGRKISQGTDVDRRAELAKFIADPKNEDLARAMVNRMWGHFLGRGFANPVDDLGPHNPPSNPELLDRLTADFQKSGYDIKALCRWITATRAYNLSSQRTKANEKDEGLFNVMQLKPMTPEQLFDSLITATTSHLSGVRESDQKKRDEWMRQFLFTFGTDEATEGTSFQGTIPQALMMMNGELMTSALSGKPGSFLADVLANARRARSPVNYIVDSIYLAALSRFPNPRERTQAQQLIQGSPDSLQVVQDLFWALLNSNEFILIH